MAYAAKRLDLNHEMKNLSKIGMMRQIATEIYQAEGLIFPELCKVKTTVDRIELLARWSGAGNPQQIIRKQTLMGCGSMLYHLNQAFAGLGWSVEVRLFPKLDREDVIAYVRAGCRNSVSKVGEPAKGNEQFDHLDDFLSDVTSHDTYYKTVQLERKPFGGDPEKGESWHFRTKDNDAIAWIRTGQMYARLHRQIQHTGRISIQVSDCKNTSTSRHTSPQIALTDQLIVNIRI
jgi:hypothetical protein